jgi:hypothetical protein
LPVVVCEESAGKILLTGTRPGLSQKAVEEKKYKNSMQKSSMPLLWRKIAFLILIDW